MDERKSITDPKCQTNHAKMHIFLIFLTKYLRMSKKSSNFARFFRVMRERLDILEGLDILENYY